MEDAVQRALEVDAPALLAELHERLDAPELDEALDARLAAGIVADVCRDLGFGPPRRPADRSAGGPRTCAAGGGRAAAGPARAGAGRGGTWRPQAFTPEGAEALMHQLLELRPPGRCR